MEENKELRGQPGIESITKQYLYQLAYQEFINAHGFRSVRNCFLMPSEGSTVVVKGTASMQMLSILNLEPIQIRLLPAQEVYKNYLNQTLFGIEFLKLE